MLCGVVEAKLDSLVASTDRRPAAKVTYRDVPEQYMSHESIQLSLGVQSRGALTKGMTR